MARNRFVDVYLWTQALKVLAFIIYAFGLILIERIARTLLSLLTFFIPHILVAAFQRRWHATIMPSLSNFRRTNSSQAVPNLSHEEAECQRELYYDACELIRRRGYPFEQHYAETPDGFLLGLHRIPHGRGEGDAACQQPGSPRPCVYLMHGFLQSSEAWLSMRQNLAFMLADAGFDVWLGNSRGNKYSCHHRTLNPHTDEYWSYCIDDVASKDVPTALTYILNLTSLPSISYIGFSQGTAVAFACFSTRPDIARKVNCFIALAPATQAKGFSQPLLDSVAKLSPDIVYLLLGRGSLFGNLFLFWQNLLTNAQLIRVIDFFVGVMFHWSMKRVHASDKPVLYSHIYSMSSVKSVVHWFQIMRSGRFQMYGGEGPSAVEEVRERVTGFEGGVDVKYSPAPSPSPSPSPLAEMASHRALYEYPTTSAGGSRPQSTAPNQQHHPVGLEGYRNGKISHSTAAQSSPPSAYTSSVPLRTPLLPQFTSLPRLPRSYHGRSAQVYPLGQIACPIHVCWGSADHLPDTAGLVRSLPRHATTERFEDYEHLDFLYAREALETVYPSVIERVRREHERYMESWRENQILQHQQLLNLSLTASSRPGSVLPGVGNGGMHPTTLIGSSVSPTELLGQQHSSHSRAMSISSAFGGYGSHTPLSIAPVSITPHLVPEHRGHTLSVATLQQLSLLGSNAAANAAAAGGGIGNGPTSAFSPPKHVTVTSVDLHPAARNGDASLPESQRVSPTPSMHSSASDHVGQSIESLFTSSVLRRDGGRCIVCKAGPGSTNGSGDVPVLAVHIVPPSSERTEAGLAQAKLLHCYETTNGLSLCPSCSASFELGLWYILPSDGRSLVISQALPPVQSEWLSRVGGQVSTPTTYKRQWPAPAVFSVQQHFAEAEWKAARKRYARRLAEEGQKEA